MVETLHSPITRTRDPRYQQFLDTIDRYPTLRVSRRPDGNMTVIKKYPVDSDIHHWSIRLTHVGFNQTSGQDEILGISGRLQPRQETGSMHDADNILSFQIERIGEGTTGLIMPIHPALEAHPLMADLNDILLHATMGVRLFRELISDFTPAELNRFSSKSKKANVVQDNVDPLGNYLPSDEFEQLAWHRNYGLLSAADQRSTMEPYRQLRRELQKSRGIDYNNPRYSPFPEEKIDRIGLILDEAAE